MHPHGGHRRYAGSSLPLASRSFLFADDFGKSGLEPDGIGPQSASAVPPLPPAITAADLLAAREDGIAEGRRSALAQFRADSGESRRQTLRAIAERLADARQESARVAEATAGALARLLMQTLRTVLPATMQRCAEAEVRALLRAILPGLAHEPKVQIRLAPQLVPSVQSELQELDAGLHQRIILTPADAMAPGDVQVLWQDGCAHRDGAAVWSALVDVLAPLGLLDSNAVSSESAEVGICDA